jgi:hypothetical protein
MRRSPSSRTAAAIGLLALAAAGPASAEIIDIAWSPEGRFQRSTAVAPGKFAEVCGPLRKGQSVEWSFESDAAMDFNIHYHQGKKVVYPAKQAGVAKSGGTLEVALDQDYCWMWTNKSGAEVKVGLTLKR